MKKEDKMLPKSFLIPESLFQEIVNIKFEKRFDNNSEVLRKALEIGLRELKRK